MSNVDLGFVRKTESWKLKSEYFPSKIGGKPAWLSFNLINPTLLQCGICKDPCIFLIQLYSPYDNHSYSFHRTIYVFICKNANCCKPNNSQNIICLRSQLPRENNFYPFEPPDLNSVPSDHIDLERLKETCPICGCLANKTCSQCNLIKYCSKLHQIDHWKSIHKSLCPTFDINQNYAIIPSILFPEYELLIDNDDDDNSSDTSDGKCDEYLKDNEVNCLTNLSSFPAGNEYSQKDLESMSNSKEDKCFNHFRDVVRQNPEQVVRYERGGLPLWISDDHQLDLASVPKCSKCGSARIFEFQIMPHLVKVLDLDDLGSSIDWGTICIFICSQNCPIDDQYAIEFAFKQDIANDK